MRGVGDPRSPPIKGKNDYRCVMVQTSLLKNSITRNSSLAKRLKDSALAPFISPRKTNTCS